MSSAVSISEVECRPRKKPEIKWNGNDEDYQPWNRPVSDEFLVDSSARKPSKWTNENA